MDIDLENDSWGSRWAAFDEGTRAAFRGKLLSSNPYNEVIQHLYWYIGYKDGRHTLRRKWLIISCVFNAIFLACIVHFLMR